MVSNLKSETARANGAKSRGPITPEGKEKSSRNSLKHGLTASSRNILLDSEDPDEFEEIFNKLLGIHEPARPAEKDLVEEMGVARWRIRRIRTIETGLLNAEILKQQSSPSVSAGDLASAYRALSDDSHSLALASRYEARLQRTYDRAYKTLRELQQARKAEPPAQPHTMHVKWVNRNDEPDQNYNSSVSEGASDEQNPSSEPNPTACEPNLPNEPTVAANKDVKTDFSNRNAEPAPKPAAKPPSSNIPEVKSSNGVVTTPCEAP